MNCEKEKRAYLSYMKASCNEYAAEISKSLRYFGYSVYFNKKSPRSGEFERDLYKAINNSRWFVIILDKHIFEDWNDEHNWIHCELTQALKEGKRIIAVKTPGLKLEEEIPEELSEKLFKDEGEVLELDIGNPENTALKIRDIIEKKDAMGKFEKTVNRVFSGIYLWRIAVFPLLGALIMLRYLSEFYGMYLASSNFSVGHIFKHYGINIVYTFNLVYIILGTLLCGIFMYITKKVLKLDIIPLFLADVAGVVFLSMMARKIVDMIFGLGKVDYWATDMGLKLWALSESVAVYMVILTLGVQLILWCYKRILNYV